MFGIICHYFFCSNWELIQSFLNLILPSLIQFVARKIVLGRITFFYFPSMKKKFLKFHMTLTDNKIVVWLKLS